MELKRRVDIKGEPIELGTRFMKAKDVAAVCGIARSTVYKLVKEGKFPPKYQITNARVGWLESDICIWKQLGPEQFEAVYGNQLRGNVSGEAA